ncbi:hypothetical protein [Jeotgalibacillus salarius]|uniref:Uncharacterized protein n=1 Tax=Jeotgalibacillus salarius TaxID=546023 RepID=A0A4Y8LG24_9BACL|nr:hypothetical protein [Jeotgalibacillus salarius]TFE01596.1 hypothetical protein E2626_08465 [Jeotgalibacillus salarius]
MKKLTTMLFSLVLLLSMATPAFASGDSSISEAVDKVDQANEEIYSEIDHGVAETDALKEKYFNEINKIEEVSHILKLKQEKTAILVALEPSGQEDEALNAALADKEAELEAAHAALLSNAEELKQQAERFAENAGKDDGNGQAVLQGKSDEAQAAYDRIQTYFSLTNTYEAERDAIIQYVYEVTLALTDQGIQEAAELGLLAECSWVHVRFGDTREWIDPIEIVGGVK